MSERMVSLFDTSNDIVPDIPEYPAPTVVNVYIDNDNVELPNLSLVTHVTSTPSPQSSSEDGEPLNY